MGSEFGFAVFVGALAFMGGFFVGTGSGERNPMAAYCKEAGGEVQEMNDDRIVCWDAASNRVIPITVTYPLPTPTGGDDE